MEEDHIKVVYNVSMMDRLKYEMLCTRLDICFIIEIIRGY